MRIVRIARIGELGGIDEDVFRAYLAGDDASFIHFLSSVRLRQTSCGQCPGTECTMRDLQQITTVDSARERDQDRSHLFQQG